MEFLLLDRKSTMGDVPHGSSPMTETEAWAIINQCLVDGTASAPKESDFIGPVEELIIAFWLCWLVPMLAAAGLVWLLQ